MPSRTQSCSTSVTPAAGHGPLDRHPAVLVAVVRHRAVAERVPDDARGKRCVLGVALVVAAVRPARGLAVGADPLIAHRVEGVEEREATAHHEAAPEQDADRDQRDLDGDPTTARLGEPLVERARVGLDVAGVAGLIAHAATVVRAGARHMRSATRLRAPGAPSGRRVLADPAVDGLAEQVGVAGVPAVLLDQVADEPAQAGVVAVGPPTWTSWSSPPSASAASSRARERSTAPSQSA